MWWCCGKRGKDAPGCKFSKHEVQTDEADEDYNSPEDKEMRKLKMQRYARCLCCKEMGHSIENCDKDPNFKTKEAAEDSEQRILHMQNFRKLHADTSVSTTHFIKKSVMVPIQTNEKGA